MIYRSILLLIFVGLAACGGQQKSDDKTEGSSVKEKQQALDRRVEKIRDDTLKDLGTIEKQLNKAAESIAAPLNRSGHQDNEAHYITVQKLKSELDALAEEVQALSAKTEKELEAKAKKLDEKLNGLDDKTKKLHKERPNEEQDEPESAPTD